MSDLLGFVLKTVRPLFGNIRIKVDREKQLVTIIRAKEIKVMTYDEVINEIERLFNGE